MRSIQVSLVAAACAFLVVWLSPVGCQGAGAPAPGDLPNAEPVKPVAPSDYRGLTASVSLDKAQYAVGETITVSAALKCTSESHRMFNPFFNAMLEQPGRIRVFDSAGKFVAQFLDFAGGSRRSPEDADWVLVHESCFAGREIEVHPFIGNWAGMPLEPGDYKLQLVMFDTLLFGQPREEGSATRLPKASTTVVWRPAAVAPPKVIAASPLVGFRVVETPAKGGAPRKVQ